MAPERERHTRRQIKEGRAVEQAGDQLAREADRLEQRSDELGSEIDQARSDWQRKRADESVPGAIPPDSKENVSRAAEAEDQDDDGPSDSAEDDENPSARPGAQR
jgi:hypothetical protein